MLYKQGGNKTVKFVSTTEVKKKLTAFKDIYWNWKLQMQIDKVQLKWTLKCVFGMFSFHYSEKIERVVETKWPNISKLTSALPLKMKAKCTNALNMQIWKILLEWICELH